MSKVLGKVSVMVWWEIKRIKGMKRKQRVLLC